LEKGVVTGASSKKVGSQKRIREAEQDKDKGRPFIT